MKLLLLENIRSAYNVGAVFRTADATAVDKILLVGHTPAPIDRFGRIQSEIYKTSVGASAFIAWEHFESVELALEAVEVAKVQVVAVELSKQAISIEYFIEPKNVLYVLGNEVTGVSQYVLDIADTIIELPMLGQKESLNISVTAGVVLYHGIIHKI